MFFRTPGDRFFPVQVTYIIPADNGRVPERKGSKYLWLYAKENLPEAQKERFEALRSLNLKVGRAWTMREDLRSLWKRPKRSGNAGSGGPLTAA